MLVDEIGEEAHALREWVVDEKGAELWPAEIANHVGPGRVFFLFVPARLPRSAAVGWRRAKLSAGLLVNEEPAGLTLRPALRVTPQGLARLPAGRWVLLVRYANLTGRLMDQVQLDGAQTTGIWVWDEHALDSSGSLASLPGALPRDGLAAIVFDADPRFVPRSLRIKKEKVTPLPPKSAVLALPTATLETLGKI